MTLQIPVFTQLKEWPVTPQPCALPKTDSRITISDHDVSTMRLMHAEGFTHKQICMEYPQFSQAYIFKIIHNLTRTKLRNQKEAQ